jgi:hypothetical protein
MCEGAIRAALLVEKTCVIATITAIAIEGIVMTVGNRTIWTICCCAMKSWGGGKARADGSAWWRRRTISSAENSAVDAAASACSDMVEMGACEGGGHKL